MHTATLKHFEPSRRRLRWITGGFSRRLAHVWRLSTQAAPRQAYARRLLAVARRHREDITPHCRLHPCVFARALSWASDRGLISLNPLERHGRVWKGSRSESVWTDADEARLLAVASPPM